jgi:acyl-CoA reductase-like NAD-dependent aldehyde dehydrogenase
MRMAIDTVQSQTAATKTAAGSEPDSRESFEVVNPADESVIASVSLDGSAEVAATVARVRANQAAWEALGIKGRAEWLYRLRDWILDHQDEIADTMQKETGKVRAEAAGEAAYVTDLINFYGKKAGKFIGDEKVPAHSPLMKSKKLVVQYRPYPVVGVISPWNFPLILSLGDAIPALIAGAAVVIKPSEITPLGLGEIIEAWKTEIGAPDVFDAVNGMGETGSALVDEVDFVQFTGSDRTARKVLARAADTLTPVSAELGGKDPMIVLRSADVERAANAATWGAFANSGQICISVERLYVDEPVYDEFVSRFTEEVRKLNQGMDGREHGQDIGAMTFPPQAEIVEEQVEDAKRSGATVITGGERLEGKGDWYPPTILTDVDHSMKVMRDETFGPVVGIMKVRDADEAVRLANDSRYGLAASVFGSKREAEAVARRLEVGTANVNDVLVGFLASDVPMGGWKDSGIGFRHGEYGIKKFVRPESLVITRFGGKREPLYFPYTLKRRETLRKITDFFNARDWRRRLGRTKR